MSSYALMLKPRWPGSFRRSLYDADGNLVKTMVFEENKPLLVTDDEFAVLEGDVGKALVYAQRDADGKPLAKVDRFDNEAPGLTPTIAGSGSLDGPPSDEAPANKPPKGNRRKPPKES